MTPALEIGAILQTIAGTVGVLKLVEVSTTASKWLRGRSADANDAIGARRILGITSPEDTAYRHDSVHSLYSGATELHPDNLRGLLAAAGTEYRKAAETNTLREVTNVAASIAHNLVLIGSPTAEGLSRAVFGYVPHEQDSDSLVLDSPPVDLPFKWMLDKEAIDPRASARRIVVGKGIVSRPNWQIAGPGALYIPETDSDGFLATDYLLITRMRNFLSPTALDEGKYLVSLGGTHGTGTRAIERLVRDQGVLAQIGRALHKSPASFQVLIRVMKMNHEGETGTHATRVELATDPVPLPDTATTWDTAKRIAKSNLDRWLTGDGT